MVLVGVLYSIDSRTQDLMGKVPFTSFRRGILHSPKCQLMGFNNQKRYLKHGQQFNAESFQAAAIGRSRVNGKVLNSTSNLQREYTRTVTETVRMFFVHTTLHGLPTLEEISTMVLCAK